MPFVKKPKIKALKEKVWAKEGSQKEEVSTAVNAPSKIYGLTQDGNDLGCEFTTTFSWASAVEAHRCAG